MLRLLHSRNTRDEIHLEGLPHLGFSYNLVDDIEAKDERNVEVAREEPSSSEVEEPVVTVDEDDNNEPELYM